MPFRVQVFQESVDAHVPQTARDELFEACRAYEALTSPGQKLKAIRGMMEVLDREVDEPTRRAIMQGCGRRCIGASVLDKALQLQAEAQDFDDLLIRLNEAHIGGGHFKRAGNVIHAAYDRCYCGSVSQSRQPFSATYCHCSCGWYKQLFETLLNKPVQVELLGSILQGEARCRFLIHVPEEEGIR